MTTFTANGFLGGFPPLGSTTAKDAPGFTPFVSNGLLDAPPAGPSRAPRIELNASKTPGIDKSNKPSTSIFSSESRLLSQNLQTGQLNSLENTVANAETSSDKSQELPHRLFVPTGLLSDIQDDGLPSVSQAFGFPALLTSNKTPVLPKIATSASTFVPQYSVRATTFDGKTVYLTKKPKAIQKIGNGRTSTSNQPIGHLLDVPIHRMMDELSSATAAKLRENDRDATKKPSGSDDAIEDTLWVDRYRPQRFIELMGNERVARETMTWVKQWDYCVFGKRKGKRRVLEGEENFNEEDEYQRPREKLLLLSGPPGLGKTTLAHVIARQAGYEVMEINASDARSGQIVDDRIRPALESGSTVGSTKPVLLIIDEIDGATGAGENSNSFIHKLVQLTQDRARKRHRPGQKRDSTTKRPILRPIICICNDLNASSLAKLRPVAYQVRLSRPADVHTVKRLKEICELEGLKADSRALTTLVGVAKGDLRGCLNTLQFVKSRGEEVTETVIRKATVGMKEAETSVISVLNNLFSPLTRKRAKELALGEEEEAKYVARLSQEINGSGRDNSIAAGCFSHYATLRRHDANFSRYEQAVEWLMTFDHFSAAMYSDGDFALNQYLPYTLVPFYPLFQARGGQRVERNQADWEHLQLTRSNEEILKSLSRCSRTATVRHGTDYRHLVSTPTMQLEFAPYINRIISPPLRPVNSQVIRPEERLLLTRLVDIMASLELRFVQERAEDGQLSYRLDPPIDVFVTYDGKRATDISVSRYAVRHLVGQEIDARLISQNADVTERGKRGKHDSFGKFSRPVLDETEKSPSKRILADDEVLGHPNKRTKVASADIADKPPTDFFGRPITILSATATKAAVRKNVEKKYRVTYRYTEGNSAAVRKPVKVGMFL